MYVDLSHRRLDSETDCSNRVVVDSGSNGVSNISNNVVVMPDVSWSSISYSRPIYNRNKNLDSIKGISTKID